MMKKVMSSVLAVVMILGLLAGCSGTPAATPTPAANNPAPDASQAPAPVSADPIKIGAITSLSGALQDYGEQFQKGFLIGLDYATNGTMEVAGRPIEIIWEDTTNVPDVAKERALKLLDQDNVDLLAGFASSSDAGAVLALCEEFERVVVLDPAAADSLTGEMWNPYVFRTGRNSAQDAAAQAAVMIHNAPEAKVAILAPDSTYGRSSAEPFIAALEEKGGSIIIQEFPPMDCTDFTPYILRIREAKPDYVYVVWAGANHPWTALGEMNLAKDGIKISTHLAEFAALRIMGPMVGMSGFTVYHNTLPDNPVNDYLVSEHLARYNSLPDLFTQGGTSCAIAIITALEKTNGDTTASVLIETMEGMEFDSPTGMRYFREEDHQALQSLFEVTLGDFGADTDYPVPELVRVIPIEEVVPPIKNGR